MFIFVDDKNPRPIYLQIVMQIKEQIRKGDLKPGDPLPSVRELAESLQINLHTVHRAYQKLRDQGIINMRLGQCAVVAKLREIPASHEEVESILENRLNELITEAFHLGVSKEEFSHLVDKLLEVQDKGERR